MTLEDSLKRIKSFILRRYGNNLAAILLFGTAYTGEFQEKKSDIDTMIFLKEQSKLDLNEESEFLFNALRTESFSTQYFHTLESIKQYIKERTSFSTYITITSRDGSKVLYSTLEFEKLKKWLLDNPPTKEAIKKYIQKKDEFELEGYFKKIKGFDLTKVLFSHFRRKLQIINYFKTGKLIFNYKRCFDNINFLNNEKEKLNFLHKIYEKRKNLSKKQTEDYFDFAKQLTNKILKA